MNDIIAANNVSGVNGNFSNNVTANGNLSALQNISAGNDITAANNISAINGNFSNNVTANGNISALQNITAGRDITAGNNVSGVNGNFTNVNANNGNFTNLSASGNVNIGENLTAGNITARNNLTGNNFSANNVTLGSGNVTGNLTVGNLTSRNDIIAQNNVSGINGNFTNVHSNNLTVTGQTIMSGLNNTGPLNNTGNLSNAGQTTLTGNNTFTGNTTVNGLLNLTNATVVGLNWPNAANVSRISGDQVTPFATNAMTGTNTAFETTGRTGAVTTYSGNSIQTVAANTTIGNRLQGAQYQNLVNGNQYIDGNVFVNGDTTIVGRNSATMEVVGKNGTSKLAGATQGVTGLVGITTNTPVTDIETGKTTTEAVASLTLTNGLGHTHGVQVFEDRVVIKGGTASNQLVLTDNTIGLEGGSTIASNGVTGITKTSPGASVGSGAFSVATAPVTVAPNTTIGNRLNGVTYQDKLNGNTLIDGNLYVNGDTAFVSKNYGTSTVIGDIDSSKLQNATAGVTGQTGVVTKGTPVVDPVRGTIVAAPESVAYTTLTNGVGTTNGLKVYEDRTELTGGSSNSQQTTLVMNNDGAKFSNTSTGAPTKVTGVADGTSQYDAVNYGQLRALQNNMDNGLQSAYSGIAQSTAMGAVPSPMAGHHYAVGVGTGFYAGQQAIAFGGKADVGEHVRVSAAFGSGFGSTSQMAANAGVGFSW